VGGHQLRLAKSALDVCLVTNSADAVLKFWRDSVGLFCGEVLPIREGLTQHRHSVAGSVIKINHQSMTLSREPVAGFRELIIARPGLKEPSALTDPEGNRVLLVPPGTFGIHQIGVRTSVRNLAASRYFFDFVLGLPVSDDADGCRVSVGNSRLLLTEDPDAALDPPVDGLGWRYITLQIFEANAVYDAVLARGGREGRPPKTLGTVARYALVRDPDGNWIELSQRASLTGPIV
jgi:catechol 2,3-dioxygenase-like lactoylglutathione lyase family enzyme